MLQEKRTALIVHAVTQGLNPNAPKKDSGIPWLGRIPEHWELRRNKIFFSEADERSESGSEELLTVSHITGITPRSAKDVNMFLAESMEGYKICRVGDVVVNTMWAWMGALGASQYAGITSPSYNVYRLKQQFQNRFERQYLDFLYRTPGYICEIRRFSKGVWESRLRLYPEAFFELPTVAPPIEEQRDIVEFLENAFQKSGAFEAKLKRSIDLLNEYRTALISAAVTGQMDVRQEKL